MKKYKQGGAMATGAVIAILLSVVLMAAAIIYAPAFYDAGKRDKALSDTGTLCGLVTQYATEIGSYPDALSDLTKTKGQYGPWIRSVPHDPWTNNDYVYVHNTQGYAIYSSGANKSAESDAAGIHGDDVGFIGH